MKPRPRTPSPDELTFQRTFMLAFGTHPSVRIWRQNVGQIAIRDRAGKIVRMFDPGPPVGAADLSGITIPDGFRLEIELKAAAGKRSPAQVRWAEFIATSGGVYALVSYDPALSLDANVAAGIATVLAAIDARRAV